MNRKIWKSMDTRLNPRGHCGQQTAYIAMVNEDYEEARAKALSKGLHFTVTVARWERHWLLRPGQLLCFRANRYRKKHPIPDLDWQAWIHRKKRKAA